MTAQMQSPRVGQDSGAQNSRPQCKDSTTTLLRPGSLVCLCRSCGAAFRGVREFDRHRDGPWSERRCLTAPRMRERGLQYDARGFWRFPRREYAGPCAGESLRVAS